ncbi:MAG: FAD-binding protein [Mycobacteriales bacterium]
MTLTGDTRTTVPAQRGASAYEALRAAVKGHVSVPSRTSYDELVAAWNLAVPMAPDVVVVPKDAEDVAATVQVAAARGLQVGVQATGHGAVSSLAGQVLVNTKHLDEVTIHPEGWARVGAGVKWGRVIEAAAPYGFAPLNGSSGDVGVVGYTTGGGVGPMARTFGLAADRVRAFEVVTGDGALRRVTPTEHPDLFFGLRGGKGALGIVTAVEFDLIPMTSFYGGALYFDGSDVAAVVARWQSWSEGLPEQATTSFALLQLPPLPFVPEPLAGKLTIAVRFVWTGNPAEGEHLLAQLRTVAPVILDGVGVLPYTEIDRVHSDPVDPMPSLEGALLLRSFDGAAAEALLALTGAGSGSPQVIAEVRQLGGAYARPGEHPSAFDHRDAAFSLLLVGMAHVPGTAEHQATVRSALAPWAYDGMWPNFGPAHDAESTRAAYRPATLNRLRATARAYDPTGVLTMGAAIRQEL